MTLTVGSLFSGIGGLDLGLERAGMRVIWQSEIDPYACRVLAKHWPDIPNLGDITAVDWSTVERPDVICGGYPCQPFSLAGVRQGEADHRHLWPHFAHAIRVLRPRYALLENVPGHLSLGFGRVLGDLADLGFDADWECVPAAAVGAPHLRYRVFVVAHADEYQHEGGSSAVGWTPTTDVPAHADGGTRREHGGDTSGPQGTDEGRATEHDHIARRDGEVGHVADAEGVAVGTGLRPSCSRGQRRGRSGDLGSSGHTWAVEPDVGRVAHGVPNRVDRLRCLGNAVVPQVAEWIGHRIVAADNARTT